MMNVYMKEKTRVFCQNSFDDLDDNIGIVMPILTECDVDEDFAEGIAVSYTHLRGPRDKRQSRMPSSA